MAYMSQEKKAEIAKALKAIIPAGWKYSLAVQHHSGIVLNIAAAPVDLVGEWARNAEKNRHPGDSPVGRPSYVSVNPYYMDERFDESLPIMQRINAALNDGNHDRSDIQSDYFDVGWYVYINLGKWDKPFQYLAPMKAAA